MICTLILVINDVLNIKLLCNYIDLYKINIRENNLSFYDKQKVFT